MNSRVMRFENGFETLDTLAAEMDQLADSSNLRVHFLEQCLVPLYNDSARHQICRSSTYCIRIMFYYALCSFAHFPRFYLGISIERAHHCVVFRCRSGIDGHRGGPGPLSCSGGTDGGDWRWVREFHNNSAGEGFFRIRVKIWSLILWLGQENLNFKSSALKLVRFQKVIHVNVKQKYVLNLLSSKLCLHGTLTGISVDDQLFCVATHQFSTSFCRWLNIGVRTCSSKISLFKMESVVNSKYILIIFTTV